MKFAIERLRGETRLAAELAALYKSRGFREYRLRRFEEYSLYLDNRDFLPSMDVLTIPGPNGRPLALRPDVTLSVVKNADLSGDTEEKLFYNEKVYRRAAGGKEFCEISQIGVEVLGRAGDAEPEILLLAVRTLEAVGGNFLIDLSHMGFVNGLMAAFGCGEEERSEAFSLLRKKNAHDFRALADRMGLGERERAAFEAAADLPSSPRAAIGKAKSVSLNEEMFAAAEELERLLGIMERLGVAERMRVNFSLANDPGYYNGIVFNGYTEGLPRAVLTGGRYDKLLEKFGKTGVAIGFALNLGDLERHFPEEETEADILLVADGSDPAAALEESERLIAEGHSVRLASAVPAGQRFGKVVRLGGEKR